MLKQAAVFAVEAVVVTVEVEVVSVACSSPVEAEVELEVAVVTVAVVLLALERLVEVASSIAVEVVVESMVVFAVVVVEVVECDPLAMLKKRLRSHCRCRRRCCLIRPIRLAFVVSLVMFVVSSMVEGCVQKAFCSC
jgi:energy-converting hydrogenase Eha subunit E